jgi:hypothetical protein
MSAQAHRISTRRAYTAAEAAGILGIHKASVYRRLYSGQVKVLSGPGWLRIPDSELSKFFGSEVHTYAPKRRKKAFQSMEVGK